MEHSRYHLPEGRREIARILQHHSLEPDSIHAPAGIRNGRLIDISDPDESIREYAILETLPAIFAAAELGFPYVVIHPIGTKWTDGFDSVVRENAALQSLERLQRIADNLAVTLALENLDKPEGNIFDQIHERAAEMGLVYCFDSGHALVRDDPASRWKRMADRTRTLHLHDNDGYNDVHGSLGSGRFPWTDFRQWLESSSYEGILGLECRFRGDGLESFQRWLIQNIQFAKKVLLSEEHKKEVHSGTNAG